MSKTKNDIAWERIFNEHGILKALESNPVFQIDATLINQFREARLMTKFDHSSQLPEIFSNNNISILPISRGSYIIGNFEIFGSFNDTKYSKNIIHWNFPNFIESIDYENITSEPTAINCAFISEMLHHFTEEPQLYPTVNGRMGSSIFDFYINTNNAQTLVNVNNSQIEIDGGFEGDNALCIIEAKNYIADDFLIRQLYYPYRLWKQKLTKNVRPIFLTYSNGVFHIREYVFDDINNYNSIRLIKYQKYIIYNDEAINVEYIRTLLSQSSPVREPYMPFPQANSIERVINLCEQLKVKKYLSKEEITVNYDFDTRQSDYYANAAKYLGLVINEDKGFVLTHDGETIFNLPIKKRQVEFVKLIIQHKVFRLVLEKWLDFGNKPTIDQVVEMMVESELYGIESDKTYKRRASTIIKWVSWIIELIDES